MTEAPIMLYDGVCNLCNGSVQFVLKRDRHHVLRFCALQSATAPRLLADFETPTFQAGAGALDTIYLLDKGRLYDRSSAALRIAWKLKFPWPLLAMFLIVPKPLRDAVYNWVGRNRYRWFGRSETCQIPDAAARQYFLDHSAD